MSVSFALLGCGKIGIRHAEIMQKTGILLSVCDNRKEKADGLAEKYGVKPYYDIQELLSSDQKPMVIAVCTPNGLHAEQSIAIMNAGIDVLCEKPMAISTADARKMMDVSEKTGRRLFIVKQNRFNPPLKEVKKILDEGKLGKIYSIQVNCFWNRGPDYYKDNWRGTLKMDGGTLFTQFSHFIDILYWLVGDVRESKAVLANYAHQGLIEFEDTGMIMLEFLNGAMGTFNYTVNSHKKNMEGSLTIFAEKGTIKIGGEYLNQMTYQCVDNYQIKEFPDSIPANDYGSYKGSMNNHDKVYENLIGSIQHGEAAYLNAAEGLKTVEIIENIYRTAKWI